MKKIFAVPTAEGKLCEHFGRCETFAIIETENGAFKEEQSVQPPAHEPGSYPRFLSAHGVSTIIAGGMGMNARQLFAQNRIEVCMGVNSDSPAKLVEEYLANSLKTGENLCDSEGDHSNGHGHKCKH